MPYIYEKPDNLVDWFETSVQRFAPNRLFGTKDSSGTYQWLSYAQVGQRVEWCRSALAQKGIERGHKVAFIGNNRWEWAVAAFATYGRGAVFVPMYESEKPAMWKYIIEHSEARLVVVSKPAIAEQLVQLLGPESQVQHIVVIDTAPTESSFEAFLQLGASQSIPSVHPDAYDTAVLIYTSGTTGKPKGVLLSHGNLTHDARAGYLFYQKMLTEKAVSLSILPWAHSYGQVAELYNWFQFGGSIGFMEKVETLADDLMHVRPTFLMAVPRVFNKIYDGLHKKMAEAGGVKLKLFNWAVAVAELRAQQTEVNGRPSAWVAVQYQLASKLVFSKIHARFGGRIEGALTASAMMNPAISRFFWNIGLPVVDAYGLTETSPALAMNKFEEFRAGSIGKPLKDVRIVIDKSATGPDAPDGEIVAYGPIVMQGYYKEPEATQAVMTPDGGLRTGDLGRYDAEGFLYITGRIKEQYKLENGKYVYPAAIEEDIKTLPYVENAMVYGDGRPYNVALVVLDHHTLVQWAKAAKLKSDVERLAHSPAIQEFIAQEITAHLSDKYGKYELPKRFVFIDEPFSLENGLLTQTMKLKRKQVFERYQTELLGLYE